MAVPDRDLIRRIVIEVLYGRRTAVPVANAPSGKGHLLVLHNGDSTSLDDEFRKQIETLQPHFQGILWNSLPSALPSAVLLPDVSPQQAAAVANGTSADPLSEALLLTLSASVPVWVAAPVDSVPLPYSDSNPVLGQLFRRNRHALRSLGVRFSEDNFVSEIINHVTPVENLTPQRLAHKRPAIVRSFVTTEDVYNANLKGQKVIRTGPDTIVTDEARSLAEQFGIVID